MPQNDTSITREEALRLAKEEGVVAKKFGGDKEVVIRAVQKLVADPSFETGDLHDVFKAMSNELKDDKQFMMGLMKVDPSAIHYVSARLRDDKDVALSLTSVSKQTLDKHFINLYVFSDRLRDDKDVVLAYVGKNGEDLQHASYRMRSDAEVARLAANNRKAIQFIAPVLWQDKDFVISMSTSPYSKEAFERIPERFMDDADVMKAYSSPFFGRLALASERLLHDKAFMLDMIKVNSMVMEYVPEELKKDPGFMLDAIKTDKMTASYMDRSLRKDVDFMIDVIKVDASLYNLASPSVSGDDRFMKTYWDVTGMTRSGKAEDIIDELEALIQEPRREAERESKEPEVVPAEAPKLEPKPEPSSDLSFQADKKVIDPEAIKQAYDTLLFAAIRQADGWNVPWPEVFRELTKQLTGEAYPMIYGYADQTHEECLDAVSLHGTDVRFVLPENQTTDVCLAAVRQDPKAIDYIADPTPEVIKEAERVRLHQQQFGTPVSDRPYDLQRLLNEAEAARRAKREVEFSEERAEDAPVVSDDETSL